MKLRRLTLSTVAACAAAVAIPASASAAGTLQPGAYHETDAGSCTLNFVYNAPDGTVLGTAAHCVTAVGERVRDIDGEEFGTVSFKGDENSTTGDFAFIKVDAEDLGRVSPAVKGYPQYPTGYTVPTETSTGDLVQASGYGVGFGTTKPTQEQRKAVLGYDDADEHTLTGPVLFGDSGGPFVHIKTGKALGIVSRLCVGVCSEEGPTVQGIIDQAAAAGYPVSLRTV